MANTYTLIASNTLTSSTASVTFSGIPNTYTDLVLRASARGSNAGVNNAIRIYLNGSTSAIYSYIFIRGDGTSAISSLSSSTTNGWGEITNGDTSTSNTFGSFEIYIPSYSSSTNKPFSVDTASENNGTTAYRSAVANLFASTSVITSINIDANGTNWLSGSSFFLYGIKNS